MNLFSKNIAKASIVISLLATTLPPAVAAPKQIWSCQAESATRKYVVDQLDPDGTEFDLAIFSKDKGDDRDYLGTIAITAAMTNTEYRGKGVTDNSRIDIFAFGRGPAFGVDDSKAGKAAGKCSVNWQMVDSRTRRSVRQCLANASKASGGNIAEVTRFGCTTDPAKGAAALKPEVAPVEAMIPAESTITAFQPKTEDEKAIVTMLAAYDKSHPAAKPMIVTGLVISDSYGLYDWILGESGGQGVVKQGQDGAWTIVRGTGGAFDVDLIQRLGVPKAIAQDLKQKIMAQQASSRSAAPKASPKPASVEAMIPAGWTLEKQTSGDLNSDRQPDVALKLVQSKTGQRALLVLLATPSGWEKLALAPKLLLCKKCAGMMGTETGEHIKVSIDNGVLVVEQYRGSRDVIHTTHRFRIDRSSKKFVCIGEDIHEYDRANGNKLIDSRNFLTGKRIVDETIVSNSGSYRPGHRTQEFKVSKELRTIESMDIETVYQNALGLIPLDRPLK
jgi:hypothetical protein